MQKNSENIFTYANSSNSLSMSDMHQYTRPSLVQIIMWGKSRVEPVWQFNYKQVNELDPLACQWWDQLWPGGHVEKQGKLPTGTRQLMVQRNNTHHYIVFAIGTCFFSQALKF